MSLGRIDDSDYSRVRERQASGPVIKLEGLALELNDYLRIARRNWIWLLSLPLLGLLSAALLVLTITPSYTSTTQLFVATQSSGSVSELQVANTFSQDRVQSYVRTIRTPAVLQPVIDELGLEESPAQLATRITASAERDTVLIRISASDSSPVRAAAIAQATAQNLIKTVTELETPSGELASPVKMTVVTPAVAPSSPSTPALKQYLLIGLLMGFAAAVAVATARSLFDTKIRGEGEVSRVSDAPILGGIAFDDDATKKPLLTQAGHQSPRAESFRQIRTNMRFANIDNVSSTTLVTSSMPGEGKSTTATNLAIALAEAGQRVVLVDADLRRPSVAKYLGLEGNAGLTTALVGAARVDDLLQPWGQDELYVLTSGEIPPNPSELLGSDAMSQLLDCLSASFDAVILDAPPLIPVTDAAVMAQKVGSVVMVVGAGRIRTQDLAKSLGALELVDAKVGGIILNMLPTKGPDAYAYSYYSYESDPKMNKLKKPRRNVSGSHLRAAGHSSHLSSEFTETLR